MDRPVGHILETSRNMVKAMVDPEAHNNGWIQPFQFVYSKIRQGHLVFRIKSIEDGDTLPKAKKITEITRMQEEIRVANATNTPHVPTVTATILDQTYKVLILDPIGIVGMNGQLDAYNGGVGSFEPIFKATTKHIKTLYKAKEGLQIGWVAEGTEKTTIPFFFTREDSSRHTLIVGKNGTGKTNLLKTMIFLNAQSEDPMSMLVFGHRDLGEDNPNDEETRGLINLNHPNIFHFGYREDLKVAPGEVNKSEVLQAFDWTPTQRHVINYMYQRDPNKALMHLANYEVDVDPYNIVKKTYSQGSGNAKRVRHQGFAGAPSIGVIVRNLQELYKIVDEKTDPLLPELVKVALRKKIALVDTSKLNPEQTILMLKLMLQRMKVVGLTSIGHNRAPLRLCVIIDEAQIYMKLLGEHAVDFAKECRKAGISLILGTQNVSLKAVPPELKGEIHNIISLQLSPANANDLQDIMPEFSDLTDVITRRPIGKNKGQICAVTNSYPFAVVGKCDRFEDMDVIANWVPPVDVHTLDVPDEEEVEEDFFTDTSEEAEAETEEVKEIETETEETTPVENVDPFDQYDDDDITGIEGEDEDATFVVPEYLKEEANELEEDIIAEVETINEDITAGLSELEESVFEGEENGNT